MKPTLRARQTPGAAVRENDPQGWHMEIPAGRAGVYRWAQVDDYLHLARKDFLYHAPQRLRLRARISAADLPGTWGFGFWNDPFNASLGIGGTARRLPALPNTAWFFYAGVPNYLALRDTHPAQGFLAATFASARIPIGLLTPAGLGLPLLALPPAARLLRRMARLLVREDAARVAVDVTGWHTYQIEWLEGETRFAVDGERVFTTHVSPRGPLGLVIWIDNQYAAFPPNGRLRIGTSANSAPAWLEVEEITSDA